MKKKFLLFALLSVLVAPSCNKGGDTPIPQPQPVIEKSISLSHKQLGLDLYETQKITAFLQNIEGTILWESSDDSVASVNQDGIVEALKEGTTVIKASIEETFATCSVSVVSSQTSPILHLSSNEIYVPRDGTYTVTASCTYKGNSVNDVEYTWQSDEAEGVVTYEVNEETNVITFTGVNVGNATFYVSATVYNIPLIETLFVNVNNPYISFDFTNVDCDENGYNVELSTLDTPESKASKYLNVDLYDHNVVTSDAVNMLTWTSDNSNVAVVEGGYIVAKGVGETVVHAAYEGNTADIRVKVFVPVTETKTLSTSIIVDKNSGEDYSIIDLTELNIDGELETVLFKGKQINTASYANKILSISNASLIAEQVFGKDDMEVVFGIKDKGALVSYTKAIIHTTIATKIIKTVADLNYFGTLAKAETNEKGIWDGYFVLGNDINYTGTFKGFINYQTLDNAGKPAAYNTGYNAGWRGVFDGCGHIINNFKLGQGDSGLVGIICTGGVVRNISFTNVVMGAASSLINESGDGLVENIFVDCVEQMQGWGVNSGQKSGFFFTFKMSESAMIRNCFVYTDVSKAPMTSKTAVKPTLGTVKLISQAQNVYIVGTTDGLVYYLNNLEFVNYGNNEVYGAYETLQDLKDQHIDFSGWANEFYEVKGGLPVPKALGGGQVRITNDDMFVGEDSKLEILSEITGVASVVYELDTASIAEGFTIEGNVVSIPEGSRGKSFTVTVRSKYDASVYDSMEFNVAVIASSSILASTVKKAYTDDSATTVQYDLSSLSISHDFTFASVKVGTRILNGSTFVNNIVTVNKSELDGIYGNVNVIVKFNKIVNDVIDTILEVKCPTLFITKIISNSTDIDYLGTYAKAEEPLAYKWGGYFILDRNIDYSNANGYTHFITWDKLNSLGKASIYNSGIGGGFVGTIDGKGFNINGFTTGTASNGLVGVLGTEGVIKNLSFTNVVLDDACSLISASGDGTVDNIYVECISQGNGWAINSDQKSGFINTFKSGEHATISNVFIKTNIQPIPEGKKRVAPVTIGTIGVTSNVDNVYAVGGENGIVMYYDAATYWAMPNNDVYGSYLTEDDFKNAEIDLTRYSDTFWTFDNGLPISISAYNRLYSVTYKVNHYIAKSNASVKTDLSTYKLYKQESVLGVAGHNTDAKAITLNGFAADIFEQKVIMGDSSTEVDIFYTRDMKKQTFEQCTVGWFDVTKAGKDDAKATNAADTRIHVGKDGNTDFCAVFNSNAGSAWINYYFNDDQLAVMATTKSISFRIKLENQTAEDDKVYSLGVNQTGTADITSIPCKKSGNGVWTTVTISNFDLAKRQSLSFWFNVDQGDGFVLYVDDFIV